MVATGTAADAATAPLSALGLDAGGTGTRYALISAGGQVLAEGVGPPLSGTQLFDAAGQELADVVLGGIARALPELPQAVVAGLSGYDHELAPLMLPRLTQIFGVQPPAVKAMSDIELVCRAAFAPGDGIVVYAGTGSVAALLDAMGYLHRAGGRGVTLDDAGGGHWIAREALRHVWRTEDEEPGAWQRSPLAHALFEQVGGNEWQYTRQWVYGGRGSARGDEAQGPGSGAGGGANGSSDANGAAASSASGGAGMHWADAGGRGQLGELATVVAAAAGKDAAALALLEQAGRELARLAQALMRRYGRHPVALAGRVFTLHPAVERGLVAALPAGTEVSHMREVPHLAAARMALRLLPAQGAPKPALPDAPPPNKPPADKPPSAQAAALPTGDIA